jgi:outer membrane protein assembly factor BamB
LPAPSFKRFNRPMKSWFFALSVLLFSHSLFAAADAQLVSRWLNEIAPTENSLVEFQRTELGGITIDGDHFFVGSPNGTLERRHLTSGAIQWSLKLEGPSQSTWTVYRNELFGGDTRGVIYSVDANSGKIKWKAQTKGVFFSRPLIQNNQLWIMNSLGTLQSYERETGRFLWQQSDPTASTTSLWSFQGPLLFQNVVIAGFPSGTLQAFDPVSGKTMWSESFQGILGAGADSFNDLKAITVSKDILVASSFSGDLRAWEATKGSKKLLWQKKISLHSPISIDTDGTLYLSARDGSVQALDSQTGFTKWQFELTRGLGTQVSISKSNLWVASSAGEVFVLSKAGKLIAKSNDYQTSIWNSPSLLSDEEALVLTSKANLRRLHLVKTKS